MKKTLFSLTLLSTLIVAQMAQSSEDTTVICNLKFYKFQSVSKSTSNGELKINYDIETVQVKAPINLPSDAKKSAYHSWDSGVLRKRIGTIDYRITLTITKSEISENLYSAFYKLETFPLDLTQSSLLVSTFLQGYEKGSNLLKILAGTVDRSVTDYIKLTPEIESLANKNKMIVNPQFRLVDFNKPLSTVLAKAAQNGDIKGGQILASGLSETNFSSLVPSACQIVP